MNSTISQSAQETANAILLGIAAAARIHLNESQVIEVRDLLATSIQSAISAETALLTAQVAEYHSALVNARASFLNLQPDFGGPVAAQMGAAIAHINEALHKYPSRQD